MSHSSKISCNNSGPRLAYGRPLSWFNLSVVTIRTHPEASQHVYMSEHNSPGCDVCSTTVSEPGTTYPHMDLGVAPGEDAPDQNFCINSGVFTVSGVHPSACERRCDFAHPTIVLANRFTILFCPSLRSILSEFSCSLAHLSSLVPSLALSLVPSIFTLVYTCTMRSLLQQPSSALIGLSLAASIIIALYSIYRAALRAASHRNHDCRPPLVTTAHSLQIATKHL